MKICFWGNIAGALIGNTDGGGELQIALLAKALAKSGHEVIILDYEIQNDYLTEEGIKILRIKNWNKGIRIIRSLVYRLPNLYKSLKEQKADVYYCRIRDFRHILSYYAAKKVKGKFVLGLASDLDVLTFSMRLKYHHKVDFKGLWSVVSGSLIEIIYPILLRRSDLVLVQHIGQKEILEKKGIKSQIFPNLIEINNSINIDSKPDKKDFVYVGWLSKRKGFIELFELIKKCKTKTFKIIGPPADKSGLEFYNKLQSFNNVILLGKLNHSKVFEEMKSCQALISTSKMEGFPNIFIEAWAVGIPVLSLYVDPGDIIKREGLGVVANGNTEELINAIETYQNPVDFPKKARQYVLETHLLNDKKIKEINWIFQSLIKK